MAQHYLQERKQSLLNSFISMVEASGECDTRKFKTIMFDRFGLSPDTTERYLNELDELEKLHFLKEEKVIRSNEYVEEIKEFKSKEDIKKLVDHKLNISEEDIKKIRSVKENAKRSKE